MEKEGAKRCIADDAESGRAVSQVLRVYDPIRNTSEVSHSPTVHGLSAGAGTNSCHLTAEGDNNYRG